MIYTIITRDATLKWVKRAVLTIGIILPLFLLKYSEVKQTREARSPTAIANIKPPVFPVVPKGTVINCRVKYGNCFVEGEESPSHTRILMLESLDNRHLSKELQEVFRDKKVRFMGYGMPRWDNNRVDVLIETMTASLSQGWIEGENMPMFVVDPEGSIDLDSKITETSFPISRFKGIKGHLIADSSTKEVQVGKWIKRKVKKTYSNSPPILDIARSKVVYLVLSDHLNLNHLSFVYGECPW